ncbi:MAG: hypothetical protein M0004_02140 [Actinomycetota bacterium]|nr:hypothetical protein [Actinomycetota bacterium]
MSSRDTFEPGLLTEASAHALVQGVLKHFGESGGSEQEEAPEYASAR